MTPIIQQLAEAKMKLTYTGSPFELIEIEAKGKSHLGYKNAMQTIPQLAMQSRSLGDKTFLVYQEERMSFTQFYQEVDALAAQMVARYNIKKGDRVAIAMRNHPEWMTAFFAICSIGAVAVPLNSWGKSVELIYGVSDSQAKMVFVDDQRYQLLESSLEDLDCLAVVVRSNSSLSERAHHYQYFVKEGKNITITPVEIEPDDNAIILYTSGTTGSPKGALSSHRSICQAIFNFCYVGAQAMMTSPKVAQKMEELSYEPAVLLTLPLFHVSGLHSVFLLYLNLGRKIVIMHKWDAAQALELIEKERISNMNGVPTMTMEILNHENFSKTDTSSLFNLGGGGAASPPNMADEIYSKIPDAFPGVGYGLTESNAVGAFCTGEAYRYNPKAGGIPSPIILVEIRDDDGHVLPQGEIGHIWLSGISIIQSYWGNADATADALVDGWLSTGDIGYLDDEGFIYIVDRAKDMIIRGGENIYAAEIEACLLYHPDIDEVAAIGIPHDKLGEELAVVIYTDDKTIDAEHVKRFVGDRLAGYKVPSHVLISEYRLPKNATGKMVKKELVQTVISTVSAG